MMVMVMVMMAGISTAKISWFRWSVIEPCMRENRIIVLPVNNSLLWHAGFLGCATHYHMSWNLSQWKFTDEELKPSCAYHKINTFHGEKRCPSKSRKMHCMYSVMENGTSWAEAMSNSEKIKPVALAIIKLCESEGIRQAGRWAGDWEGRQAVNYVVENSV